MASQGERVTPDGGHSAARVMLDHCGGLEHLLRLGEEGRLFNQSYYTSREILLWSITFSWAVLLIRGEQDRDLIDSLLLLPGCTSLFSPFVVWLIGLLPCCCCCCWMPELLSKPLLKPCMMWRWFWIWLRLHVNSTENSSPEGESINVARPPSERMTVSPPCPGSASQEDHSGQSTSVSMLKKGCSRKSSTYIIKIILGTNRGIGNSSYTFLWSTGMSSSGRYGRLAYLFLNANAATINSCKMAQSYWIQWTRCIIQKTVNIAIVWSLNSSLLKL